MTAELMVILPAMALGLPAVAATLYLAVLTLLSAPLAAPPPSSRRWRFDIVVPAHNEAQVIARTVQSLQAVDWPADQLRIIVVADNCSDETALRVRELGAQVLERRDETRRGKGYALDLAFRHSLNEDWADAVVIVDADTVVSPNLLEAFAARIDAGAGAMQAHYGVLNPAASWRTLLIAIAHGAFHILRSRARERLGVSCGLRGDGWCVTHDSLRAVPYAAYSLTEDLEYGIVLGLAGRRVHYAFEADADAEMSTSAMVADTQRRRWEQGRRSLIRHRSLPLLLGALRQRSAVCLDLALDLLLPPLASVSVVVLLFLVVTGCAAFTGVLNPAWLASASLCAATLMIYVLRGWALSGVGSAGAKALLRAPLFVVWKLRGMRRGALSEWVPTQRESR